MLAATATHGHAPAAVCPACIEPLSRSAELYRGDFLAGFSLRDSPGFDDWQFYMAEGLRQEAGDALRKLLAIHGRERQFDLAIDCGRRWLALDPLNEEAHRQLMLLYALNGQRSAALHQYQECQRLLQSEMGIAPERKTSELFGRIEQGAIPTVASDGGPVVVAAGPSGAASPFEGSSRTASRQSLPQPLTPFIGRERDLAALDRLLSDPQVRLLTILAVGGMGKTRLAIEAATRLVDRFPHGAHFVYLAPLQAVAAIPAALAQALDLPAKEGVSPEQQVLNFLREKRLLLVLDNFEHLLEGADLVSQILQTAPGVQVLATSRLPLNLQGEHRYHLAGMAYPTSELPGEALDYSAVKLFVQGARRALPSFKLEEGDWRHVAAICRLVDGMPLGILLAAGWTELLPLSEIAGRIEQGLDFLETELQDVPERQRSMHALLDQAWSLLGDGERQSFMRLCIFRGSFDRQAAQEVSGATLRLLMSLVNKSMLTRLAGDRLVVHELLRHYAAERLAEDVDAHQAAHDRHSALYCRRLQAWAQAVKHPSRPLSMVEIERDLENAQAAWSWAALDRQVGRLADAAEGMGFVFSWPGRKESGEAAFKLAGDALDPPTNDEERVLLGYLLAWQARLGRSAAHEVAVLLERSLTWLDAVGVSSPACTLARAFILLVRGETAGRTLDWRAMEDACEESLALFERIGESWWVASALRNLGYAAWSCNDRDRTMSFFQRSLAILQEIGDQAGTAHLLANMGGLVGFDGGQVEEAQRLFHESSRLFAAIGGRTGELVSLAVLFLGELLCGRFPQALEIVQRQVANASNLGDTGFVGDIRWSMGVVLQLMGQYDLAEAELRKVIADLEASGWTEPEIGTRDVLAATLLGLRNYSEARQVLQPNIPALEQSYRFHYLGRTLAAASRAELGLGNIDAAWEHALRAVELLSGRHYFWLLEAMAAAAALLAERGEVERAVEIYALVNRHPYVANSRWFGDVFGQSGGQSSRAPGAGRGCCGPGARRGARSMAGGQGFAG